MAAVKVPRSRGHSGAPAKENLPKLEESLNAFRNDRFDPQSYVQSKCSLNEKEIKHLCSYLMDLKKASAEEMRRSVYANYTAFIRTSKEISDLEGELLSIRNLLTTQATLIHGLAEGVHMESSAVSSSEGHVMNGISNSEEREPSDLEKWLVEFPDHLDVLLAERRVNEALTALNEGERVASEAKETKTLSPDVITSLEYAIKERRQKFADQLVEAACQPTTRGTELRASVSALKKLGDGPRAHTLLLSAHLQRYQYNMQSIRPSSSSYGGAYTAALSQLVFSAIAQAASDSLTIFGSEPAYTSELVTWATQQIEAFAHLVKRHALASSAAAGGLRAAAECVQIALGHCSLLEGRGLSLCPTLVKLFRPSVEQAVDANFKRIEESTAALAAADDWILTYPPTAARHSGRPLSTANMAGYQYKLTSSAHRFISMVQDFFEDVGPLQSMQLGSKTLEGVYQVFNSYVVMLIKALPNSLEEEANFEGSGSKIVRMAENEAQQIALLANASLLADELLPRAAMKFSQNNQSDYDKQNRHPELREWKRRLELFFKLNTMASIAAEMFAGKERFATLLMMKLTETVILWFSQDQSFWDDIEDGPKPLGPLALQQLYLDMKFVICFASQGRYLSRNLVRVINEIISKAIAAFQATGRDPYSVLPEDNWFNDICQDAIELLSGKPREINGERDLNSPTASVSAQSVSSFRSHGSS
uniref:Exocyst component Exo84 C-terminal domain-containing protein n=1 Tax=Chenopodium quinoa TaxID=63459 RepID=A0A803KQR8_CHEQI